MHIWPSNNHPLDESLGRLWRGVWPDDGQEAEILLLTGSDGFQLPSINHHVTSKALEVFARVRSYLPLLRCLGAKSATERPQVSGACGIRNWVVA